MKRIFAFVLITVFMLSLCACKSVENTDNTEHNHDHDNITSVVQDTTDIYGDITTNNKSVQHDASEPEGTQSVQNNTSSYVEENGTLGVLQQKHSDKIDVSFDEEYQKGLTVDERIAICNKYTTEWETVSERYFNELLQYKGEVPPAVNYSTDEQLHSFLEQNKSDWEMNFASQSELYISKIENGPDQIGASLVFAQFCYEAKREYALYLIGIYEDLAELNGQVL